MYNKTDTPYSMRASVYEYKYYDGLQNTATYRKNVRAGSVVESGDLSRRYVAIRNYYYIHQGHVYVATGTDAIYEGHQYRADQNNV